MCKTSYKRSAIIIAVMVLTITVSTACMFSQYDYPMGRDTAEAFGNAEFQLGKFPGGYLGLSNEKCNVIVISSVIDWKKQGNTAYFIGTDQGAYNGTKLYGVLKIKENLLQLYWEGELDAYSRYLIQTLCESGSGVVLTTPMQFLAKDWEILMSLKQDTQ